MPIYALLGATGATGSSILRCLLSDPPPNLQLNILVRSKTKLLSSFPDLTIPRQNPTINLFEGDATSPTALLPCLTSATTIFLCIGTNTSTAGSTLYTSTTTALITTLSTLRSQQTILYHPPTVLQLRSASLNPPLAAQVPAFVHKTVLFCLHHAYTDLRRACTLYPDAFDAGLLDYILIDPPTLHHSPASGYALIGEEGKQAVALGYEDLGAAMCEIARNGGEGLFGKGVGVGATGRVRGSWGGLVAHLVKGGWGRVREGVGRGVPWLYGPMAPYFVMGCVGVGLGWVVYG